MKTFLLIMLMAQTVFGISDALWQTPPQEYTNVFWHELYGETRNRHFWATAQPVGEALDEFVVATNAYFNAVQADLMTGELDSLLAKYTITYYLYGTTNFDAWFAQYTVVDGATNYVDHFPLGASPKADLIHKLGDTNFGFIVHDDHVAGAQTNQYGEVTNSIGYWIKRRDRIDPLIVAEWRAGGNWHRPDDDWAFYRHQVFYEYYRGTSNEFTRGDSQLFGLLPDQYPVFIVRTGGTNAYVSGLSLSFDDADTMDLCFYPGGQSYQWHGPDWDTYANEVGYPLPHYEWTNNHLREIAWANAGANWDGGTITLNSATQRSERAWLDLSVPLSLHGNPPNPRIMITSNENGEVRYYTNSGDTVSLQYIDKMNTYEGSRVWDSNLFPEQLNLHYAIFTNMYLTEITWDSGRLSWAPGMRYTNEATQVPYWSTNYLCVVTNFPNLWTNSGYAVTVDTMGLRSIIRGQGGVWLAPINDVPANWIPMEEHPVTNVAPQFHYSINTAVSLEEDFRMETMFHPPYRYLGVSQPFADQYYYHPEWGWGTWPPYWSGTAYRTDTIAFSLYGWAVSAPLAVTGMYTGTPHRVHFYAQFNYDRLDSAVPSYHLVESSAWTTEACVTSSVMNASSNVAGFEITLSSNIVSANNGPLQDDTLWREWAFDVYLPSVRSQFITNHALNVAVSTNTTSESFSCELTYTNGIDSIITNNVITTNEQYLVVDMNGADPGMIGTYSGEPAGYGTYHLNGDPFSGYDVSVDYTSFITIWTPYSQYDGVYPIPADVYEAYNTATATVSDVSTYVTNEVYTTNWNTYVIQNDYTTNWVETVFTTGISVTNIADSNKFTIVGWEAYYLDAFDTPVGYYLYTNFTTAVSQTVDNICLHRPTTSNIWEGPLNVTNCAYENIASSNGVDIFISTNSATFTNTFEYPVYGAIDPPYELFAVADIYEGSIPQFTKQYVKRGSNTYPPWSLLAFDDLYNFSGDLTWTSETAYYAPFDPGAWEGPDHITRYLVPPFYYWSDHLYYNTLPLSASTAKYTLPLPMGYSSNTVGWASSEGVSWQSGAVNITKANTISVKVLVEWQR